MLDNPIGILNTQSPCLDCEQPRRFLLCLLVESPHCVPPVTSPHSGPIKIFWFAAATPAERNTARRKSMRASRMLRGLCLWSHCVYCCYIVHRPKVFSSFLVLSLVNEQPVGTSLPPAV